MTESEQLAAAADHHVAVVATWWRKIPEAQRGELANYLAEIVTNFGAVAKQMPPGLSPTDISVPGMQLYGIMKGYEGGAAAVAAAVKRQIPELAPLADALTST